MLEVKCLLSAPAASSAPSAPRDVLEALEQRRAKYEEASSQAKASGDDRKARMHDRIAKVRTNRAATFSLNHNRSLDRGGKSFYNALLQQYQSAIRAHKAGRAVNFDELPTPPGENPTFDPNV